jgi:hypothetical protein
MITFSTLFQVTVITIPTHESRRKKCGLRGESNKNDNSAKREELMNWKRIKNTVVQLNNLRYLVHTSLCSYSANIRSPATVEFQVIFPYTVEPASPNNLNINEV